MGESTEKMVKKWNVSREEQDDLAHASHSNFFGRTLFSSYCQSFWAKSTSSGLPKGASSACAAEKPARSRPASAAVMPVLPKALVLILLSPFRRLEVAGKIFPAIISGMSRRPALLQPGFPKASLLAPCALFLVPYSLTLQPKSRTVLGPLRVDAVVRGKVAMLRVPHLGYSFFAQRRPAVVESVELMKCQCIGLRCRNVRALFRSPCRVDRTHSQSLFFVWSNGGLR